MTTRPSMPSPPLRWLQLALLSLLWTTIGSAVAVTEREDFGHSTLAANSGGRLIHLTDEAGEAGITATNSLRGNHGIFAVPSSVAGESTALKVARTGVMPAQTTNFVNIPEAATGLFTRPVPIGPYST
jgi:hypothetical protein